MDVGFEYAMTMSAEGPRNGRRSLNALQKLLTTLFEKIHVNELSVKQLNADFKVQAILTVKTPTYSSRLKFYLC